MNSIVRFCINNRAIVIFMVLLAGAVGVRAALLLPIDVVPDVTNVQVQILTSAPALAPLEVEQYISAPVEVAMSGLPGVEQVRSLSRFGLSAVTVVFEEGTDIYLARQLVAERLPVAREAIPAGYGSPEMGPISTGLGEIFQFEVRGEPMCAKVGPNGAPDTPDCYTLMELRTLLDWFVAYQLRPLPGVVEVNTFGGELKTYEVQVDPHRMVAMNVTLREVFNALERNNANAGGGYLQRAGEQLLVRGEGLISSLEDVRDVVIVTRAHGTPITIRDVAEVAFAPMLRQGAATRDGRGEAVTGIVMMLLGANSGQVSAAVKERLDQLKDGLPKGVTIETYYDRAVLVDRTIRTVTVNLIEGGVLVLVVLLLLLGNLRGGLLVAAVIPLAMLGTLTVMYLGGVSGNLMSLGALDFGMIIDGAIVVMEQVITDLGRSKARGKAVGEVVRSATAQVMRPVLYGVAIIMIVYVPILSLGGIEGKLFRPMAVAVLGALFVALVLSFTLLPSVSSIVFQGGVSDKEPLLARLSHRLYAPLLALALRFRLVVVLLAFTFVAIGGYLASGLGAQFAPRLDEGAIALQAIRPPSVSLEESLKATTRVETVLLRDFPTEVSTVVSRTGRAEIATDPMGVEVSDIYIILKPREEWQGLATKAALITAIKTTLDREVPGQNFTFSQPIELRTNELISGVRSDVAVNIYGPDMAELQRVGEEISAVLAKVPGAADASEDQLSGLPTIRVQIRRKAAARFGVSGQDILDTVAALGGHIVGTVFEGQKRFPLQVRLRASSRSHLDQLRGLLIAGKGGVQVPLAQVATIELEDGPSVVNRDSAQRRKTLQINVRGRDLAGFVADAQAQVHDKVKLPTGYTLTWGGQFENLKKALARLAVAVPSALALIFLLLFTSFGAVRPALLIYFNIPVAAVGGIMALWARGMPLSISAAIGFIALSGIAVLNGLVMVSLIRDLQRDGMALFDATQQGAQRRLRAVLMTAMTGGLGFLPMALSEGAGAEVQQPLATVVVGGLISATVLTLFVLPAIYSWGGGEVEG